jgi:anti-sigma-K factor RskA
MIVPVDDEDVLAAEYVLGLLEGPELVEAQRREAVDPAFAAQVERWAAQLQPMLAGAPMEPPAAVWQRISARLAANDDLPAPRAQTADRFWRFAAIGASAVAASLALVLVTRPAPAPVPAPAITTPQPALVASLQGQQANAAVTISVEDAGRRLLITPVRLVPDGHTPELWIIPEDGVPRSLGLIEAAAPSRVAVPASHRAHLFHGATFAISLEPAGGAPGGAPTGPIAASGKIVRL